MHLQNNAQRVIVGKDTTSIHPNHILHQFHLIVISVTSLNRHHNVSQTDRYLAIQGNIIFDRCSVRSRVGLSGVTGGMTGLWACFPSQYHFLFCFFAILYLYSVVLVLYLLSTCVSPYLIMLLLVVCGRKGMKAMDKQRDGGIPRSHETMCQPGTCYWW